MPVLTAAPALYVGSLPVTALYLGSTKVWPPGVPTLHGQDITADNTGYDGHVQPDLGRALTASDLTVQGPTYQGGIFLADLVQDGATFQRVHFTGPVIVNRADITFIDCLFDKPVVAWKEGVHYPGMTLNWCTVWPQDIDPSNSECVDYESYTLYRCKLRGCSDAVHIEGGSRVQRITECFLRITLQTTTDHSDAMQCAGGTGLTVVERCNISAVPEGNIVPTPPNGASSIVQCSEFTPSSNYRLEMIDNLISPGTVEQALRFYDGALTPTITYKATGNIFVRGSGQVLGRGSVNMTPADQIEWSNNRFEDDLMTAIALD